MSKETILIVDDEEDILELIKFNLKSEGYNILQSMTGEEAIKTARQSNPDLIVLDLMLPGIDGLEVTRSLKKTRCHSGHSHCHAHGQGRGIRYCYGAGAWGQ